MGAGLNSGTHRLKPLGRIPIDAPLVLARLQRLQTLARTRTRHTLTRRGVVVGPMHGADQIGLVGVPEPSGLPVHLDRHVGATVQVSMDPAIHPHRESRDALTMLQDLKQDRVTALHQGCGIAQQLGRPA